MARRREREPATAFISRGEIVIRLPIEVIPAAYMGGEDVGAIDPGFKITDAPLFARDVIRELNRENPDNGVTAIHRLFDAAMIAAIEDGAEGVEDDPPCPRHEMAYRHCGCKRARGK
jgi:hypothetical protein